MTDESPKDATKAATSSDAAAVNHFSCCRSVPCERRKRTTIETAAAIVVAHHSAKPTQLTKSGIHATPSGLSTQS